MTISQYAVNAATGALTSLNSATLPSAFRYPDDITVDLTSSFAYLSNINGNTIFEYGIGADGTLGRANPASVAAGTVSQYAVGTAGQLTPLVPSTVLAGTGPGWIAFDPFRKYVYVVNIGNGTPPGIVSKYAIGTGGALTLIGTATAGVNVFMIATAY